MTWLRRCGRRLRGAFSRFDDRAVRQEVDLHLDLLTEEFRDQGFSEVEARSRAERTFGNRTRAVELTRAVTTLPWLESLLNDVIYGARQLRRSPAVTILAVASLAVGIGANTAVFSIVDALVLRSLPVPAPDRLAALSLGDQDATRVDGSRWSYAFWKAFVPHHTQFDGVMAWSPVRVSASRDSTVQPVDGVFVNGGFFAALRLPVGLGRPLEQTDDRDGAPSVVVISHGYWQRQFGGAADVIGRTILVHETPFAVVGVTRPGFIGLDIGQAADIILPLSTEALVRGAQSFLRPPFDGMNMWLRIGVRLRSDQSLESGSAILRGLQPQLREASLPAGFPQLRETHLREPIGLISAANGLSRVRQLYRRPLNALMLVVGVVLLLACVNVANLLLAQATAREQELGVAVGARRVATSSRPPAPRGISAAHLRCTSSRPTCGALGGAGAGRAVFDAERPSDAGALTRLARARRHVHAWSDHHARLRDGGCTESQHGCSWKCAEQCRVPHDSLAANSGPGRALGNTDCTVADSSHCGEPIRRDVRAFDGGTPRIRSRCRAAGYGAGERPSGTATGAL